MGNCGIYLYIDAATTTANLQSLFGTVGYRNIPLQFGATTQATQGQQFWLGLLAIQSTSNSNVAISTGMVGNLAATYAGVPLGVAVSATNASYGGVFTNSTNAMPNSIGVTAINQTLTIMPIVTFSSV